MSDTPRTDASIFMAEVGSYPDGSTQTESCVDSDFARQLERELNAEKAKIAKLRNAMRFTLAHHWHNTGGNKMTNEEKRIKIAEACGWTYNEVIREWVAPNKAPIAGDKTTYGLPNYFNDLNAMHEAESVLTDHQWEVYRAKLYAIMPKSFALPDCKRSSIHATAAQRAEAFGLNLNLWEVDE